MLELETREASKEWVPKGSVEHCPEKAQAQRADRKSMFTIFFDQEGPLLAEFKDRNENVTSETYIEVLRHLCECIQWKHPTLWSTKGFIIHHNNASPHTAFPTEQFLNKHNMTVLPPPSHTAWIWPLQTTFCSTTSSQNSGDTGSR